MINTILFDFVGVLLFQKTGYITDALTDAIDQEIGAVTSDSVFKEWIMRENSFTPVKFHDLLQAVVNKYEAYEPLWGLLPELRKRYKLGIINNGSYLTYPLFEKKYHLSTLFDIFVSSAIEGVCKPDRLIYLRTCEKIGSSPQNCLFMDDRQENVVAAQKVGMQGIHWMDRERGFRAFNECLRSLGSRNLD